MEGEPRGGLTYQDTAQVVLCRLGPALRKLVLVGGQAVNFWALRYRDLAQELEDGPFASKDVDLFGARETVAVCAQLLNGTFRLPSMDDVLVNSGLVLYQDAHGVTRQLDILSCVLGVRDQDIRRTAVPISMDDGLEVNVMHPLLCMQSRVHNVVGLPTMYDTPHGLRQLRASIVCLREFLREMLDGGGDVREALRIHNKIFRFCQLQVARRLFATKGIDPFDASKAHERLPPKFRDTEYPRRVRYLARLRQPAFSR